MCAREADTEIVGEAHYCHTINESNMDEGRRRCELAVSEVGFELPVACHLKIVWAQGVNGDKQSDTNQSGT